MGFGLGFGFGSAFGFGFGFGLWFGLGSELHRRSATYVSGSDCSCASLLQ